MSDLRALAAGLEELARWMDDELAAHVPGRWVAAQAVVGIREAIRLAREQDQADKQQQGRNPR